MLLSHSQHHQAGQAVSGPAQVNVVAHLIVHLEAHHLSPLQIGLMNSMMLALLMGNITIISFLMSVLFFLFIGVYFNLFETKKRFILDLEPHPLENNPSASSFSMSIQTTP
jgi:hypothetical protein